MLSRTRARLAALVVSGLCLVGMLAPVSASAASLLSWTGPVAVDPGNGLRALTCPSTELCVAVDNAGNVVTSTDPADGASSVWTAAHVDDNLVFNTVTCATTTLCVAGDYYGNVVTTTDPTGGAAAWTLSHIDGPAPGELGGSVNIAGVSCPSASLCIAADVNGNVLSSTAPASGAGSWHLVPAGDPSSLTYSIACPSAALCVGVDQNGQVFSSTDPAGGSSTWSVSQADTTNGVFFDTVACPSTALCMAADDAGNLMWSTSPADGSPWNATFLTGGGAILGDVACGSPSLCAVADIDGTIFQSTNPTGGQQAWSRTGVLDAAGLGPIACASEALCVAGDGQGRLVFGTPGTGASPGGTPSGGTTPPARVLTSSVPAASAPVASASVPVASAPDTMAPVARVSGAARQKLGRAVLVGVACLDEPCTATASGTVAVPRVGRTRARTYRLPAVTKRAIATTSAHLAVKLSASARRAIASALKAHRSIVAKVKVVFRDAAGNTRTLKRNVKLTR